MMTPRRSMLVTLLTLSVASRLTPYVLASFGVSIDHETGVYPWNFSPILPISLFGGAVYADRRLAYLIPWATFFLGDLGIWALTGRADWAFYAYQPLVYLSVIMVVAAGWLFREQRSWSRIAAAGLLSATVFFLVTNFGVWAFGDGIRYPHTGAGLIACYVNAVPYFRNTLVSMALFLPLLFSRLSLVRAPLNRTSPLAAQRGS